jgi:hypothetical protein
MTMLHAKEMVLPAHLSTGVQQIIQNGGTGGRASWEQQRGGSQMTNHIHIDAIDNKGMDRVASRVADQLRARLFEEFVRRF